MDLFVVNRYYGDERSSNFLVDPSTAQKEEYNQISEDVVETPKVKKRKKKDSEEVPPDTEVCDTNLSSSKKKKSKENRDQRIGTETESVEDINSGKKKTRTDDTDFEVVEEVSSKKKKKKKSLGTEDSFTSENNPSLLDTSKDLGSMEQGESSKKKKKRKSEMNDVLTIENEITSNDDAGGLNEKKKKRKSKSNPITEDLEVTEKDVNITEFIHETSETTTSKKKKRKSEANPAFENQEETLEHANVTEPSQETSVTKSSKKKKRKSESCVTNNQECIIEMETNSNVTVEAESKTEPNDKLIPNTGDKHKQNKNAKNKAEIDNTKVPNENSTKPKKRFRQRSRINRVKNVKKDEEGEKEESEVKEENSEEKKEVEEEDSEKDTNDLGGFQVIGNLEFQRKKKVRMVLPDWLAKPTVVSINLKNLNSKVEDLEGLDSKFKKLLRKKKVTDFFPVQSELIPFLIKQHSRKTVFWPRDVCVSAPTGSGKTLAFVLPILQLLQHRVVPRIRALVVLPTQDLASQVYSVFRSYIVATRLKVVLTVGSSPIQEEQKELATWDPITQKHVSLVDIVVTTPGRLVDHITNSPGFDLSSLKFLVVDEADRMIDNNDCNWLLHINKHINYEGLNAVPPLMLHTFLSWPCRPQRLLFSATLSHDPEKLHQLSLFEPKLFTSIVEGTMPLPQPSSAAPSEEIPALPTSGFIGKFTTPAELSEKLTTCSTVMKPLVLYHLIKKHAMRGVLCFVNTTEGAHRLAKLLHHLERLTTRGGDGGTAANQGKDGAAKDGANKEKAGAAKSKKAGKSDKSEDGAAKDGAVKRESGAVQEKPETTRLNIAEVYSDLKFDARNKIIEDFRRRKIDIVVASDNLARGIDVENIDVVINYEAPDNIKKYIHRIGRTARGGRQGTSVTLVTTHEKNTFLKMLSGVGKTNIDDWECTEEELEYLEQAYAKALECLKKDVEREGEIIMKIAKADKKGKKIKTRKTLLDGRFQKNSKTNKTKSSKTEKKPKLKKTADKDTNINTGEIKSAAPIKDIKSDTKVEKGETKTAPEGNSTGQKSVKRNEIKKVVKKNAHGNGKTNQFNKKPKFNQNKKKQQQTKTSEGMGKTRNMKIKLKKQMKKKLNKEKKSNKS